MEGKLRGATQTPITGTLKAVNLCLTGPCYPTADFLTLGRVLPRTGSHGTGGFQYGTHACTFLMFWPAR